MHAAKTNANDNNNISNYSNNNHSYTITEQCTSVTGDDKASMSTEDDAASDYIQWLHAMKLVAQLPGGMPPEFRRKLWLSLADKYLKAKKIDWEKEEEKCFCEKWREDDEELGIQIVKDLHRTGSNLCTGPSATVNQAKLKRILLGYARYNPEVGYCQGFNMLGALILQVMDKNEYESMKVMIYLVEGVLPPGYFHGSMCGLQADMGVFRELMQTKLPRLAKHLQKLQGPVENAYEPPLTNVFTMQWFLTMFCTCLPMTCVLRVWDLVLIEGSDVLLRTALVLWSLLEERVLSARTADDFYCKMGSFSSELLNGHLIDSNGLVEKVVKFGTITDIQKLRDKHLYNIAPLQNKPGIQLYYDDEDPESDEESRLAIATIWGLPWGRRGSHGKEVVKQQPTENKERLALDISLLKKQYDRLRERQKQAQLILTTACNTARNTTNALPSNPQTLPVNQLLLGRQAIMSNRGKRIGAPSNLIPPARKPSLPAVLQITKPINKKLTRGETLHWRDTDFNKSRRDSLSWKEIKADREAVSNDGNLLTLQSKKVRSRIGKSDSSSYSEESEADNNGSSTDTSLCDEEDMKSTDERTHSSIEDSPKRRPRSLRKKKLLGDQTSEEQQENVQKPRPKSWAPSTGEIPFELMPPESPNHTRYEKFDESCNIFNDEELGENDVKQGEDCTKIEYSSIAGDLFTCNPISLANENTDIQDTVENVLMNEPHDSLYSTRLKDQINKMPDGNNLQDSDTGVTNQYFERVNSTERPTKLDLYYSLNEEDSIRNAYLEKPLKISSPIKSIGTVECLYNRKSSLKADETPRTNNLYNDMDLEKKGVESMVESHKKEYIAHENQPDILKDTFKKNLSFEKPSDNFTRRLTFSAADETEIFNKQSYSEKLRNKRRDPRRMTLTRASTIEIEERFQALEKCDVFQSNSQTNHKLIPSTADLEARYRSLQRHIKSDSQDQTSPISTRKISFQTELISQKQSLPESDEIITNLTRQMSSNGTHVGEQKHSPNSDINEQREDKPEGSSKAVRNTNSKNFESVASQNECEEKEPNQEPKAEKPVLKKLPSTAELEDRFNALERRISIQKSVTLKAKKKPPEDEEITPVEENNTTYRDEVVAPDHAQRSDPLTPNQTNKKEDDVELGRESEHQKSKEDESSPIVEDLERPKTKTIQKKTIDNEKSGENNKKENIGHSESCEKLNKISNLKMNENGKSTSFSAKEEREKDVLKISPTSETYSEINKSNRNQKQNQRKSPPSTEELETRFRAMEKQLSLSKLEQPSETTQRKDIEPQTNELKDNHDHYDAEADIKTTIKDNEINTELNHTNPIRTRDDNKEERVEVKTKITENEQKESRIESNNKEENLNSKVSEEKSINEESRKSAKEEIKCKPHERQESKKAHDEFVEKELTQQPSVESFSSPKRRGSEPPSTVDLEKRYEILKRRMSSRTVIESSPRFVGILDTLSHKSKGQVVEKTFKEENEEETKLEKRACESKSVKILTNLPSTEDLESRYEALQMSSKTEAHRKKDEKGITSEEIKNEFKKSEKKPIDNFIIPQAPPQPVSTGEEFLKVLVLDETRRSQQRALVEELQNKIKTPLNGENLKPSTINPNRKKFPKTHNRIDGTSEAHASSAFHWSENHELWHPKKTVRRFSDLPSRADLENRLEFLERQLYAKFKKQRCASDSEVTSMKTANVATSRSIDYEMPSTSQPKSTISQNLEERVQALEKQLSENSLKLLETLRLRDQEACPKDIALSRQLSTETINVTGRELVRYTHSGELEETETNKPFNINIHIKMSLASLEEQKQTAAKKLPTTEELEKRLQILEKQIQESSLRNAINKEINFSQPQTIVETVEKSKNQTNAESPNREEENNIESKQAAETAQTDKNEVSVASSSQINECRNKEVRKEKTEMPEVLQMEESTKKPDKMVESEHAENTISISNISEEVTQTKKTPDTDSVDSKLQEKVEKRMSQEIKSQPEVKKEPKLSSEAKDENDQCKSRTVEVTHKNAKELNQFTLESTSFFASEEKTNSEKENCSKNEHENFSKNENENCSAKHVEVSEKELLHDKNIGLVDSNKTTVVLLMDNQPKTMNVRRLTRANTEELEGLFEALEQQLSSRNLVKGSDGKLVRATNLNKEKTNEEVKAIANLTNEIVQYTSTDKKDINKPKENEKGTDDKIKPRVELKHKKEEEPYDWGVDPIKHHLKRKTVYLPSTKELEARFRSFERQIKFLEDVEKIDVEQRLTDIERKIKLQYSLSHEKDLSKFLELCEGKDCDDLETVKQKTETRSRSPKRSDSRKHTPQVSPSNKRDASPYTSPNRSRARGTPSPVRSAKHSPYSSPPRKHEYEDSNVPCTEDLEYRFRALDLKRSKSKENLQKMKKQPIHPLEMLLDPSPDDSQIPTTGELEHRMRLMDEKQLSHYNPSKRRSPSGSPKRELPTADELEARMRALEEEKSFDMKTQKTYKEFNQKLKEAVSPSLSFEEFKAARSREQSPHRKAHFSKSKSVLRNDSEEETDVYTNIRRPTSPKVIRFSDETEEYEDETMEPLMHYNKTVGKSIDGLKILEENSKLLYRILQKTLTGSNSSIYSSLEGLEARGAKLLRETSPLRRTGTHTGVPLKTDLNINDRLDSIKNSIKSIDSLCEDKPYRKEKCQRYIDSLFSDSLHFSKKNTSEDHRRRDYGPSIRVSEHTERPSEYLYGRSLGSAESLRTTSPLRAASPLHHRSNRELRREISPRRRREEDREEHESRVRRENMFPSFLDNHSNVSRDNSLTQFHKVDRQLDPNKYDVLHYLSNSQSTSRSPLNSPYGSMEMRHKTTKTTTLPSTLTSTKNNRVVFDRALSTYRPSSNNLLEHDPYRRSNNTPVYNPGKLEIRHTTVTSTFYDRLLTEKQIEKSLNRTPVVSPSVTSKSYTDLSQGATNHVICNKTSPTAVTVPLTSSYNLINPNPQISGNLLTAASISLHTAPTQISHNSYTDTSQLSATNTTTTGMSTNYILPTLDTNYIPQEMRIRSCDNIPMNISTTKTSTTVNSQQITLTNPITNVTAISSSFGNSGFAYNPITLSSLSTSTESQPMSGFSATSSLSTGVYNPVMPFIMRQPPDAATISSLNVLGQNTTNIDCNLPKL